MRSIVRTVVGAAVGLLMVWTLTLAASRAADDDAAAAAKARMSQLRALAGQWTGKASHGEAMFDCTVEYRLTAAGNTVQETQFPGTNHEMVTMYHRNCDDVLLTHYCAAGNQPRMKAQRTNDKQKLVFQFLDGTNLDPEKDMHMHEATIEFVDADHIKSEWISYRNGKPIGAARFDLQRSKKSS